MDLESKKETKKIRFSRPRHKHEVVKEIPYKYDNEHWDKLSGIQICSCKKRRSFRVGFGRESGVYHSRWFDIDELDKLKDLFYDVISQ